MRQAHGNTPATGPHFDEDATMNMKTILHVALAAALVAGAGSALAQDAQKAPPQVQELSLIHI